MTQPDLFDGNYSNSYQYRKDDIIVLSLQPYAYEKIKNGSKRMEYRTRFRKRATIAVLYVSAPIKEIRGIMFMGVPIIDSPEKIGKLAENHIKGNGAAVYEYMKGGRMGYAIPIERYIEIPYLPLNVLRSEYQFTAPQSYAGLGFFPALENYIISLIGSLDDTVRIV